MGIEQAELPRILVVDDEVGACEMLADFLTGCDYEVICVHNGKQALDLLQNHPVDLVLTDVDMPKMTGTELLEHLHTAMPELPVILITGKPSIDTAVSSLRMGAKDFVTKPFDLLHLRKVIEDNLPEAVSETRTERTLVMEQPERVIGGYTILRTINEGAMGVIYEAEQNSTRYALKLIRSSLDDEDQRREQMERFVREAELASHIQHPHIVRVHDYGLSEEELVPFIVMEYIEGLPLNAYSNRLPAQAYKQRAALLADVADALAHIHNHNICHRDIKPPNILVTDDGQAKMTDFGIARAPDSDLTLQDQILGSPLYMAPESFITASVDARADLFSFGSMAYEFLCGAIPFDGDNLTQVANRICRKHPRHPRQYDRAFPRELIEILAHCLKKEPDVRYQSAADIAADLRAFVNDEYSWKERIKSFTQTVIFNEDWS